MKALTTFDLKKTLQKDVFCRNKFKAVLPRDFLPTRVQYPSAYIVNTHPSYKRGEHWLAIYYDENGKGIFFDSFGMSPAFYHLEGFLNKTSKEWEYNKHQLQSFSSMACGYYCLYFIMLCCRGLKLNDIVNLFSKNNFNINDLLISFIYPE
jgi:hypothetical protein